MAKISISTLLDAGTHFGHQTRRWNPKMKPYIFGNRGDIYILDLKQTLIGMEFRILRIRRQKDRKDKQNAKVGQNAHEFFFGSHL